MVVSCVCIRIHSVNVCFVLPLLVRLRADQPQMLIEHLHNRNTAGHALCSHAHNAYIAYSTFLLSKLSPPPPSPPPPFPPPPFPPPSPLLLHP